MKSFIEHVLKTFVITLVFGSLITMVVCAIYYIWIPEVIFLNCFATCMITFGVGLFLVKLVSHLYGEY
jgi:hypothetical protein